MGCLTNAESSTLLNESDRKTDYTEDPIYLNDGERQCDYVLCYELNRSDKEYLDKAALRRTFQENLKAEGLELEYENDNPQIDLSSDPKNTKSTTGKVCFVKIHAPWEVLCKWAEITRLRKPIAKNDLCDTVVDPLHLPILGPIWKKLNAPPHPKSNHYDFTTHEKDECYYTAPFDRARIDNFLIPKQDKFFQTAERQRIVLNILNRTQFGAEVQEVGINRLIQDEIYTGGFPLHEGSWRPPHMAENAEDFAGATLNKRQTLYWTWARPGMWLQPQPLELIRQYFGEKIGMYFAWLGFYTLMLIPVAIFGIIVFIYGIVISSTDTINLETCNSNITMCPRCDNDRCPFLKLSDSCFYTQVTRVFDNDATVIFAFVMSLWATFFLEFWKRKKANLVYKWDLENFEQEQEQIRPEFESVCTQHKVNLVTGIKEPHMPLFERVPRIMGSFSMFLVLLVLVVGALFGVILYRMIVGSLLRAFSASDVVQKNASLITSVTASVISFVAITIFNLIYQKVAEALTNLEAPRTATDFEDSYTLKMFLFQSVNYYSSLFYIAFFKGKLNGTPYDYSRLFGFRAEECDASGCLIELCIQLGIIMILKQGFNNSKEIIVPILKNWFKHRKLTKEILSEQEGKGVEQYHRDYALEDPGNNWLFSEYLEMVIQFGFITLFVASFPLAPAFALLNNIIEIRLDAYKFTTQIRRLPARQCEDIGMWFPILQTLSTLSVITNGVVIAFTSEFVPRMMYLYSYGPCGGDSTQETNCLDGYVNSTLAEIPVEQVDRYPTYNSSMPDIPETCWFRASSPEIPVQPQMPYWSVLATRVVFLILFEHFVFGLKLLFDILIPDVSKKLKLQMERQNYLELKIMYEKSSAIAETRRLEEAKLHNVQEPHNIEMEEINEADSVYPKLE